MPTVNTEFTHFNYELAKHKSKAFNSSWPRDWNMYGEALKDYTDEELDRWVENIEKVFKKEESTSVPLTKRKDISLVTE